MDDSTNCKVDYQLLLEEIGMTEVQVREYVERDDVLEQYFGDYEIKPSPISGVGLFATRDFKEREVIGWSLIGALFRTHLGRFTNHCNSNNATTVFIEDINAFVIAVKDIKKGDEILLNYRDTLLPERKEVISFELYNSMAERLIE